MASIFSSSFFSIAGQKERLTNAVLTVGAAIQNVGSTLTFGAISKSNISATNPGSTLGKVGAIIANNPAQTAGIAAIAVNPSGAVAAIKATGSAVATAVKSTFSSLSPLGKVATIATAPIAVSAIAQSPKLQSGIANAPSSLTNFGTNVGKFVENPSGATASAILRENPVIAAGVVAAGISSVGLAAGSLITSVANTVTTRENTTALASLRNDLSNAPAIGQSFVGTSQPASVLTGTIAPTELQTMPVTQLVPSTNKTAVYTKRTSSVKRKSNIRKGQLVPMNVNKQQVYISVRR